MTLGGSNGLTLATKVTIVRLALIPAFVLTLVYRRPGIALAVFLLASLADAADGYLARHRGETTALGALLDPAADKLLMFIAYVFMGAGGQVPLWLAALVVGRDVVISLGFLVLYLSSGSAVPAPTMLGKATAAAQMGAVLLALLAALAGAGGALWLAGAFWLTGALTAASGVHYVFFVGLRLRSHGDAPGPKGNPSGLMGER